MPVLKPTDPFPIADAAERALDRRRFLRAAGTAAVAVLAGEWRAGRPPAVHPGHVRLAPADQPAIGEARALVATNGADALAVRVDADTLVAFERRCPHLGCPVVWSAARARFECPCHRAVFEARTGRVLAGPPSRGLTPLTLELA
jgi:Rieske Fe-S protein